MKLLDFLFGKKKTQEKAIGQEEIKIVLPQETFNLVSGSDKEGPQMLMVINTSLKECKDDVQLKRIFGFFCSVIFQFKNLEGSTWPTQEEVAKMQDYTDKIDQDLKGDPNHPNALLVARITENGFYQMIWMLNNPHIANEYLNGIVTENRQERDFEYLIERDIEWNKIEWLLQDFDSKE
mgnify:CR=1 FL=1